MNIPQRRILETLSELHFATVKQLTRRHYSAGSLTSIISNAKALNEEGYVGRTKRMLRPDQFVYFIKPKGYRFLLPYAKDYLPSPPTSIPKHWLFQEHTLAVNDIYLAARDIERSGDVGVTNAYLDQTLKRRPVPLVVDGRAVRFVPDAWVDFDFHSSRRSILFEMDRGTEEEQKWRGKVRRIVAFTGRPALDHFGTNAFTVAIPVVPPEPGDAVRRAETLMHWTHKELAALGKEAWGGIFLFSVLDAAAVPPSEYFLGPRWNGFDGPHALLEG